MYESPPTGAKTFLEKLMVVDSDQPWLQENNGFAQGDEFSEHGSAFFFRLATEAKKRGIATVTAEAYLAMQNRPGRAMCLTDMVTPHTDELIKTGAEPAVCMSLESPLIAKTFYHKMAGYAGRFHHNFQFRGTTKRLSRTKTIVHPIVVPVETRARLPLVPWENRQHLILVNSNKRAFFQARGNFKEFVRSWLSKGYYWYLQIVDPWMRVREIYKDRIEAIHFFSNCTDFHLYGQAWDQPIQGFGADYQQAVQKAYKGPLPGGPHFKRETMGKFKFALCFENCSFPGYITEKIVDCFLAGCVPIYFGAPDIVDFVPAETFIDYRTFSSFPHLEAFLRNMTKADFDSYIDAAGSFLARSNFDIFTVDYFVEEILRVIDQEFDQNR